eukprot:scaffold33786_cov124-Isochrysis_galbana.AAC.8
MDRHVEVGRACPRVPALSLPVITDHCPGWRGCESQLLPVRQRRCSRQSTTEQRARIYLSDLPS